MLYFIGWSLFLLFFKFYFKLKVIGRQNVPKKGAFIFVSNHTSFLDPILLGVSLYRSLNYMAREDLFDRPLFGWIMRKLHSFPVKRDEGDFGAIKETLRKLKEGKPLVIFPEGGRSKDGTLNKGKPGVGFIVSKASVPVVPAYIKGSFEALPKGVDTLKHHPIEVYIGRPIVFDERYLGSRDKSVYQKMSDEIMQAILELKERYENKGA